jgi:hypothetical protein
MQKYKKIQINKTITYLDKLYEEANKLYNICKEENAPNIVTPTVWLLNQDAMRIKWAEYNVLLLNISEDSKNVLLNSSLSKYMSFMYDSYPDGFGKKLFEYCDNNNDKHPNMKYHAAEIYLMLTEK